MFDDNLKGGPSRAWGRLKEPIRILSPQLVPTRGPVGPPAPGRRPAGPSRVQAVFGLLGVLAGAGASLWAWSAERSIALSIYVFCMVSFYVGRGLGDVVTDPGKVRRFFYFSIFPVVGTAILIGVHRLWGMWWLAALLAIFVGVVVWALLGAWWFPDIEIEENADTKARLR